LSIDGTVSYEDGWTPDYNLEQGVDPNAKDIPRDQSNELFFDVTDNIKQYQEHAIPEFINTADNGGFPFPYDEFAQVIFTDGNVYESNVAANTDTPPSSQWDLIGSFQRITDLVTLSGVPANSVDNGVFNSIVVPDNSTTNEALQLLSIAVLPPGHLTGIGLENDSGDTDHDIKFNIGKCRDEDDTVSIDFSSAFIKQIDVDFAVGTNQGGIASAVSPVVANTTYHCFIISKPDGTTDAGFDTSLTATNLLADATGFDKFRRVASLITDSSANIFKFIQIGDKFIWDVPFFVVVATSTTEALQVIQTPLGISTDAIFTASHESGFVQQSFFLFTSPLVANSTPSVSLYQMVADADAAHQSDATWSNQILTDTLSRVRLRCTQSRSVDVLIDGYIDTRGRL